MLQLSWIAPRANVTANATTHGPNSEIASSETGAKANKRFVAGLSPGSYRDGLDMTTYWLLLDASSLMIPTLTLSIGTGRRGLTYLTDEILRS